MQHINNVTDVTLWMYRSVSDRCWSKCMKWPSQHAPPLAARRPLNLQTRLNLPKSQAGAQIYCPPGWKLSADRVI